MNEKVNIAELLKDCPQGMELDCTMWDNVSLIRVLDGLTYPIKIETPVGKILLDEYGCYTRSKHAKCVIFPKGKTTWEGFVPPCQFKAGDVLVSEVGNIVLFSHTDSENLVHYHCIIPTYGSFRIEENTSVGVGRCCDCVLATQQQRQRLYDKINISGYKYNQSTNKLEKLVGSKFHEGEWITVDKPCQIISIDDIGNYIVQFCDDEKTQILPKYYCEAFFHFWTIQDAKDGDVLFHSDSASNGIFIFKEISQRGTIQKVICYCDYDSEDGFCLGENHTCCWTDSKILHPATKEQCNLLSQKIKEAGYKWNEETKTLEKLVQPKFKIGDKVKRRHTGETYVIDRVNSNGYFFKNEGGVGFRFEDEWLYESVPNKFDINTLKPFDRVLVRGGNTEKWNIQFFDRYEKMYKKPYICLGHIKYAQCVPYIGNEHLSNKRNKCDEYYNTWD